MSTAAPISPRAAEESIADALPIGAPDRRQRAERDHLLDRLHNLRTIVPVLATELASARRQAAQLRVENRKLAEQLRRARADGRARASAPVQRVLSTKSMRDGRAGTRRP